MFTAFLYTFTYFWLSSFVHLPSLETHKLSHQATKCVFLGCSDEHKGFLGYNPAACCTCVSRNLVFLEYVPSHSLENNSRVIEVSYLPQFSSPPLRLFLTKNYRSIVDGHGLLQYLLMITYQNQILNHRVSCLLTHHLYGVSLISSNQLTTLVSLHFFQLSILHFSLLITSQRYTLLSGCNDGRTNCS